MNFQQLRTFRELTRRSFSLTEIASITQTTQPGLTRQIRDLENELGLAVFERHGKRITGLSKAGQAMLQIVDRLLDQADRLLGVRDEYESASSGTLRIATTHTQARYALPASIVGFREALPEVRIEMRQCSTEQVARLVASCAADIGIAGDALASHPELTTFPCYSWRYRAVVPEGHPLLGRTDLSLRDLAAYPILNHLAHFSLGDSPLFNMPVTDLIWSRLPVCPLKPGVLLYDGYSVASASRRFCLPVAASSLASTTSIGARLSAMLRASPRAPVTTTTSPAWPDAGPGAAAALGPCAPAWPPAHRPAMRIEIVVRRGVLGAVFFSWTGDAGITKLPGSDDVKTSRLYQRSFVPITNVFVARYDISYMS
ncbi:LysR substrate-binding domain-containing protein [Massilia niastensis]|uniref:LysR substrate-binding domain-containing protein n=1 Tax=Massilia niastensis TaxID=544911 RepID=UPI000381643B|nr:LysR substrate-binding domain-containing protein [Massilia niastensis]